jgi:hypothetical protein
MDFERQGHARAPILLLSIAILALATLPGMAATATDVAPGAPPIEPLTCSESQWISSCSASP